LRRHLIDDVLVSDLCDEHQLSPTLFYTWQKQFIENGPVAFERRNSAPEGHLQRTIAALRDKLQRKEEVVAELMEEHIKLKKRLGSSERGLGSPRCPRLPRRLGPPLVRSEVETIIRRARQRVPGERPRIISDNGPQFIKDFEQLIRICEITYERISPYYLQSNGKFERWHKTLEGECIRVKSPRGLEDARRLVTEFVAHYNELRLHSAIGYVDPADKLAGRDRAILAERDRKLDAARQGRKAARGESAGGLISAESLLSRSMAL
jgi:hypothetical protein